MCPEKQLSCQVSFTNGERDSLTAMRCHLEDEFFHHQATEAASAHGGVNSEIQQMQTRSVQLVDHEPVDAVILLDHHADAISLTEASEEVVLCPGKLETGPLGSHDLGHVPTNHPPNVNRLRGSHLSLQSTSCAHERTPSPSTKSRSTSRTTRPRSRWNLATPPIALNPAVPPHKEIESRRAAG
jgi:hypothetical protein